MDKLLRQAAARGIKPDYVRTLLAAFQSGAADERRTPRSAPLSLVEPFSERELQVLRLLATHLPTTVIAQELVVSANTVRAHVKKIYRKLNVHKRADAVRRARKLRLL